MTPIDRRFERLGRLISEDGVRRLNNSHVMVCGMGGVGSWAVEALARSGVGRLTLLDFDKVTLTTINRQLPGSEQSIGVPKVDVMAERVRNINPNIIVDPRQERVNPGSIAALLDLKPDYVIDAIDQLGNKCALIAATVHAGIPIVTSTGAGGRFDPTCVRVTDLSMTSGDPLARMSRIYLRKKHHFPAKGPFFVPAVYSIEKPTEPITPPNADAEMSRDELQAAAEFSAVIADRRITSDMRNVIMGTACFVTSVFGMTCASVVVRGLLSLSSSSKPIQP